MVGAGLLPSVVLVAVLLWALHPRELLFRAGNGLFGLRGGGSGLLARGQPQVPPATVPTSEGIVEAPTKAQPAAVDQRQQRQIPTEVPPSIPISAAIVEGRCHPALPLVLANLHQELPNIPVQLFYSALNQDFVNSTLVHLSNFFAHEQLPVSSWLLLVPLSGRRWSEGIKGQKDYSSLLVNTSFWDMILGRKVLTFQPDSWICRNASAKLPAFMPYDYVGAPWAPQIHAGARVGNGGLSLRTRAVMRDAAANLTVRQLYRKELEDRFFAYALNHSGLGLLAPTSAALQFSAETWVGSKDPFGVHKSWKYLKWSPKVLKPNCLGLGLLIQGQQFSSKNCSASEEKASHLLREYQKIVSPRK